MKITAKTLQQQTIELEIDAQKTVLDLKKEIAKKLEGDYLAERQKLICAGIVLENERTLASYNITEDKLVVVMLLRDNSLAEQSTNTETRTTPNSNQESRQRPLTQNEVTEIISDTMPQQVPSESAFLSGEDYKQAVDTLVEMGFEREMVTHAMAASYNNPERAFEYLMNGIPDDVEVEGQNERRDSREVTSETVNQVLQLLRQNPALLQSTLEQMGVTNPEILQQIRNNPDAFFNLMQQSHDGNNNNNNSNNATGNQQNITPQNLITPERINEFRESLSPNSRRNNPNAQNQMDDQLRSLQENLTQTDRAAIERLMAMGFDEGMAVQAYIACDKDETMAANFLVSNNDDE